MMDGIFRYSIIFIFGAATWYLGFHMGKETPCNETLQSDIWAAPDKKGE